MAKTDKDQLQKRSELIAKAVKRGEKLERTLTKLVAYSDPGSAAESFLKSVQEGLKAIRKGAKSKGAKPAIKRTSDESAKKPTKRKSASKKPVLAEAVPPTDANVSE